MITFRIENDLLGQKEIPENAYWGIHTARAVENFSISGRPVHPELIKAYAKVKLACAKINTKFNYIEERVGNSIQEACQEIINGKFIDQIIVDAFQGGAGTSLNLNLSEVIANRALEIMQENKGNYSSCDPVMHVNLHQSTNDTFPTALRIAILELLKHLEDSLTALQESAQAKEKEFNNVLKMGRTELMDAVPMTLGRTFGAWAEAFSRDRWRIFKCTERIRVINLGGTAIGTGITAPRNYIFAITEELRAISGLPLARADNLLEATQNQDAIVEMMGMLKTLATNLLKMSGDLRLLNMGPDSGLGEIQLPALQAGSSIMPAKVNPVIPEMLAQVAMQVCAYDQAVTWAAASGQLELNAFLPLMAHDVLESLSLLTSAVRLTVDRCLNGIVAMADHCRETARYSRMLVTALIPVIGYHQAGRVAEAMAKEGWTIEEAAGRVAGLAPETVERLVSPEAVNALGYRDLDREGKSGEGETRAD